MGEFEVYVARFAHYLLGADNTWGITVFILVDDSFLLLIFSMEIYIHTNYSRGFSRNKWARWNTAAGRIQPAGCNSPTPVVKESQENTEILKYHKAHRGFLLLHIRSNTDELANIETMHQQLIAIGHHHTGAW